MSNSVFYIYSKDGCSFCEKLTGYMDKNEINYQKFNLGEDFTTEEFMMKFGRGSTFPQVSFQNKTIGGMKDTVRFLSSNKWS